MAERPENTVREALKTGMKRANKNVSATIRIDYLEAAAMLDALDALVAERDEAIRQLDVWRASSEVRYQRAEAAERRVEALEAALNYLFATWLPTAEYNGPRDCAGTSRGCSHCSPDARLEQARALAAGEPEASADA